MIFTKADWLILAAASLSFLFSVSLWFGIGMTASKESGLFVELWVPSIPYHYSANPPTDLSAFQKALQGTGIEVRLLEWYPKAS